MTMNVKHKIEYFNLLDKWILEYPDKKVAIDGQGDMTYAQMDDWSARIYAWLKNHGIGREDFVMIHTTRGAKVLAAVQGIFKAGAAYVVCPTDFPKERFDFVYKDCGCKLEITDALYEEMMQSAPLVGREEPDLNDAVYAVYTSGTEGNPKGVLHEYGKLDMTWKSARCDGEPFVCFDDIYGLIAPCNFGVFNICTVHILANGGTIFMAPAEIVKNPQELKAAYEKVGVTVTYLPPSFLRALNGFNSQLRKLMLCSEMANGVYYDDIILINAHAMSESCFETATFLLDKAYDAPPIGKPQFDNKVYIIDGEYCFDNAYFRGYINKPEMTAKCMKDGIYHSGDLAHMTDDGNIVLTGRKDFMLKISGNRVEPAEVEGLVKRGLNLKHVVVRGYKDEGRSYLCAYYTDDVEIKPLEAREALLKLAPKYMIPEYYIWLDEFPLIANGKMDYQALKKPDVNDYRRAYVAPESETEKEVCAAFEDVLGLNEIGLDDDFFEMGGDSIRAIRLAVGLTTRLKRDDVGIGSPEVYALRTPRAIAKVIEKNVIRKWDGDEAVPAEVYSQYMLDYQERNPDSVLFSAERILKFKLEDVGDGREMAERLVVALKKVCDAHPQLQSIFAKRDGVWYIVSAPEKQRPIVIEEMSEAQFEKAKEHMDKIFGPGECVYDFRIIITEKNLYLFYAFFHPSIDGNGIHVFRRDLAGAMAGEELNKDHYLKCRAALEAVKGTERYEMDRAYLEEKFGGSGSDGPDSLDGDDDKKQDGDGDKKQDGDDAKKQDGGAAKNQDGHRRKWECIPTPDHSGNGVYGEVVRKLSEDVGNQQMLAATLAALARYNAEHGGGRNVMATWIYHNRDTKEKQDCVGLFIRDIMVGICIEETDKREDILRKVEAEIEDGIRHMSYQWSMYENREILSAVNQGDMRDVDSLGPYKCEPVELPHDESKIMADNPFDIEFNGGKDKCFVIRYNTGRYDAESAERFADLVQEWFEDK